MDQLSRLVSVSVGKKAFVAVTGLLLCGFIVTHLAGNLLLLVGPAAFDKYAEALASNPLIIPAEIVLVALFLGHIVMGLKVTLENRKARPEPYAVRPDAGARTIASATMKYTGLFTLVFLVIHVATFKFFHEDGTSLHAHVVEWFQSALYALFYVLAMVFLGLHLGHGFQSAFQTLGLNHPRYAPAIRVTGIVFATVMAAGFGALPLWAFFLRGQ